MKNNKSLLTTALSIIVVLISLTVFGVNNSDSENSSVSVIESIAQTENFSEYETEISDEETESTVTVDETSSITDTQPPETEISSEIDNDVILAEGSYTTPEDVAEYIHTFGTLPDNFITKKEASAKGWISSEGNLWEVAEGMSIGGDHFGNYEGLLPEAEGRKWTECDVNYNGGFRGSERIIFSNDGLIFYTDDHYKTFVQLY